MASAKVIRFIDLFSGAGGLAQGFRQASNSVVEFRSVFAVESDPVFASSYSANFGEHVYAERIEALSPRDLPEAEIVIGGPPCQGFSPLGRFRPTVHHLQMNELWKYFFRVVQWLEPRAFVMENVPQFLHSPQMKGVRLAAQRLGYQLSPGVLNAADFGVPQLRKRAFVIGVRGGEADLPTVDIRNRRRTVRDAIGDLLTHALVYDFDNSSPQPRRVTELHLGRRPSAVSVARYRCVPPGGNRFDLMRARPDITPDCWMNKLTGSTDVFGRLEWGKPALAIRTEFYKPEKGRYLHPRFHRAITHLEAARLQSFPDSFYFCGSKAEIARQIGNAVPPRLAEAVATSLSDYLTGRTQRRIRSRQVSSRSEQLELVYQ